MLVFFRFGNYKLLITLTLSLLIVSFHFLRFMKGDFAPEETSLLTPNSGTQKIFANYDGSNQALPDGRVTNLIPFGLLIGRIFSSGTVYFHLIFLTYLTLLTAYAIYKFLGIWKLQLFAFMGAFSSMMLSFSFIYSTYYQTKTYGLVLFLLGSTVLLTHSKISHKLIWLSALTVITYGVIGNPATLFTSLLFYLLYLYISKEGLKTKIRNSVLCLSLQLVLYLPGIILYYLNPQSLVNYKSNLENVRTFFGNNLNILVGRGYWAEFEVVEPSTDTRYFPWMSNYSDYFDKIKIVLILFLLFLIFVKIALKEIPKENLILKFFIITLVLGYLQMSAGKWNIIFWLQEWNGFFNIWREPWSKFNTIFLLFLNLFLWSALDNVMKYKQSLQNKYKDQVNLRNKKAGSPLDKKLELKKLKYNLRDFERRNQGIFFLFKILIVFPIIFYAQIVSHLLNNDVGSNKYYNDIDSLRNTYKSIEAMNSFITSKDLSMYDEVQICSNYNEIPFRGHSEYQIFSDGLFLFEKKPVFRIGNCQSDPHSKIDTFSPLYPYSPNIDPSKFINYQVLKVKINLNEVSLISN